MFIQLSHFPFFLLKKEWWSGVKPFPKSTSLCSVKSFPSLHLPQHYRNLKILTGISDEKLLQCEKLSHNSWNWMVKLFFLFLEVNKGQLQIFKIRIISLNKLTASLTVIISQGASSCRLRPQIYARFDLLLIERNIEMVENSAKLQTSWKF